MNISEKTAQELIDVMNELLEYWDNGTPVHPGAMVTDRARAAVIAAVRSMPNFPRAAWNGSPQR